MERGFKIKSTLLSVGIAIVFIFFIWFGIRTFYSEPQEWDFCRNISIEVPVQACNATVNTVQQVKEGRYSVPNYCYCDKPNNTSCRGSNPEYTKCNDDFNKAMDDYNLKVFIIMVSVGAVVIVGSFFIPFEAISSGLMGGGLLSIFWGSVLNWGNFREWMKFILFGAILFVLIWVGYKMLYKSRGSEDIPISHIHKKEKP